VTGRAAYEEWCDVYRIVALGDCANALMDEEITAIGLHDALVIAESRIRESYHGPICWSSTKLVKAAPARQLITCAPYPKASEHSRPEE